ncbi:putative integral membrane protein [Alloactinosynnema sp. L-07]|uniref:hypothetical protein n=1 Tax=Alloactinosynnema sp. L-07 TaxID=1653480 RepID=UPI00065EF023|nr:hypothetical protein [Alloactinosynnema sp. L-07]CRK55410.1 putative integral membrane protein [Alloactinosynnema sp. L-07]
MASGGRVPARGKRTAITLVCALAAGAVGHVVAGGAWSGPGITTAAALLLLPSWLMTVRERRFPAIAALLAAGQLSTHVTLTLMSGAAHPGHGSSSAVTPGPAMLLAHAAATVGLAWWIRRGERQVFAGLRRLWRTLCLVGVEPDDRPVARPAFVDASALARVALLRHAVVLRGPPFSTV